MQPFRGKSACAKWLIIYAFWGARRAAIVLALNRHLENSFHPASARGGWKNKWQNEVILNFMAGNRQHLKINTSLYHD